MKKSTSKLFAGVVGGLVVLGILLAVNALFSGVRLRKDMTEEQLYTLSPGTVNIMKQLDQPVTLKFYFSKGHANLPMPLKNYVQRTTDFLRDLTARSGGKVTLETFDPKPDSDAEEWAQRYGLAPQLTGGIGSLPDLYLGLVAVSGTRESAIPFLDPGTEPQMEYLVARLIQEVTENNHPRIGIMSSLPVLAEPGPAGGQDWLFVTELKKQYDVVPVPMESETIPEGIDTLMLIHPKGISDRALFAVDQFLLKGGRLMAYVDPFCISEEEEPGAIGMSTYSSSINRLSGAWGVTVETDRVIADLGAATPINIGGGRAERLPAWLSLRAGVNIDPKDMITEGLETLMMPFAGAITGTSAEGLSMTPLVFASGNAVTLHSYQARNPDADNTREGIPAPEARLAVRLSGTFKTAFPDGRPPQEGETNQVAAAAGESLEVSEKDGAVILISDADLLANNNSARAIHIFGQTLFQPFNDNLNFTLNMSEQLSGNPALIGLRSRGKFNHPFDRVLAMEKAAQEQWQAQEERLQEKLMDTQRRINSLQAAKSADQQLVLSPEQKAEVAQFRQERFETQRQLKEVRKNLRHSIETLGLRLKVINMAAIPLLVILFGIAFGWRRHKQSAA